MADIIFTSVSKSFGSGARAVDELSVTFRSGEFVCLLGPSGCGKTTTLRMIAGLERPDRGEIRCGDVVFNSSRTGEFVSPDRRGLGLMFQSYALWPHMTVEQNIAFGLTMQRVPADRRAARCRELLEMFRLKGLHARYPAELSGGQQQRVALARMLAPGPNILLLDEPLSNLDAGLRLEMRAELMRLHKSLGCTVIFVTHDQLEAMSMATSIVVMNKGRIEQMGRPMEIYSAPRSRFVASFVGSPPVNMIERIEHPDIVAWALSAIGSGPGKVAFAGIRPEAFRIQRGAGPGTFEATVDSIQPTGAECVIGLWLGEKLVFMRSHELPDIAVGDRIWTDLKPQGVHFFDAEGHALRS